MPKKFSGENSKSAMARRRKEVAKEAEAEKKRKEAEDALWKDDDKSASKRKQKKEQEMKKKQLAQEKKAELQLLLQAEIESVVAKKRAPKLTRKDIMNTTKKYGTQQPPVFYVELPLEENFNKKPTGNVARTIDEAIAMLSINSAEADNRPERKRKAAYLAYEQKRIPQLKEEFPKLKLSQLKQMLFKEWGKSPENPLNRN